MESKNEDVAVEATENSTDEQSNEANEAEVDKDALIGRLKRELTKTKKALDKPDIKNDNPKPTEDDEIITRLSKIETIEKKRQFQHAHGLTPDITDKIFKFDANPSKETLEDPFIKSAIEGMKKKDRVESNTPSSASASRNVNGKTWNDMTPEEKKANYGQVLKSITKNR